MSGTLEYSELNALMKDLLWKEDQKLSQAQVCSPRLLATYISLETLIFVINYLNCDRSFWLNLNLATLLLIMWPQLKSVNNGYHVT